MSQSAIARTLPILAGIPFSLAEAVFREDLQHVNGNGWGLFGLGRALRLQNKADEAGKIEKQFDEVWRGGDVQLKSACFCQQGV